MHENEPSPSSQPEHVTSEQIPHSGIHHDERPVNEFDNTPLPEAMERGLVSPTPDTPAGLEQADPAEKKSHKKLVIGGAAFLAGAALVAGSIIGIKAAGDAPKNTPPAPDPKATSQTPEATPTPTAEVLTVTSLEVPAGATPEQLGITFFQDRLSAWVMAGATPEVLKQWVAGAATVPTGEFVTAQADQYGNLFADALLVPNWRDNPSLATWVANEKKINANYLESWLLTYNSGIAGDTEAFKAYTTVESTTLVSQGANIITLQTIGIEHNNADKNRIGSKYDPQKLGWNGTKFTFQYALQTIDGKAKISALQ